MRAAAKMAARSFLVVFVPGQYGLMLRIESVDHRVFGIFAVGGSQSTLCLQENQGNSQKKIYKVNCSKEIVEWNRLHCINGIFT